MLAGLALVALLSQPVVRSDELYRDLVRAEKNADHRPDLVLEQFRMQNAEFADAPLPIRLRWYNAAIQAAIFSGHSGYAEELFGVLWPVVLQSEQVPAKTYNLAGIWLRRSGYTEEAVRAYLCAAAREESEIDRIKYFINIGIAYRQLGALEKAQGYYSRAVELLKQRPDSRLEAALANNLGILMLAQGDYRQALTHFARARFLKEGQPLLSSSFTASLNLLHTLLLLKDFDRFVPIFTSATELLGYSVNASQHAYYHWIGHSYRVQTGQKSPLDSQRLMQLYLAVSDASVAELIAQRAEQIGFALPVHPLLAHEQARYSGILLNYINSCPGTLDDIQTERPR